MPYFISGIVQESGSPVQRTVRSYRRDNGVLTNSQSSDPINGSYLLIVPNAEHYVIALDDDSGTSFNALIYDRITPEFTAGWASWDPADKSSANVVLSNDNMTAFANNESVEGVRTTWKDFRNNGGRKFFWKQIYEGAPSGDFFAGLIIAGDSFDTGRMALWRNSGSLHAIGSGTWTIPASAPGGMTTNDELWFALDETLGYLWMGINGVWANSGNPALGTSPTFTDMPNGSHSIVFRTDNTAGAVQATLITDDISLTADCPSGFTPGVPGS